MARPGVLLAAAALAASPVVLHCLTVVDAARPLAVALSWGGAALLAIGLARAAGVAVAESAAVAGMLGLALYLGAGTRYAVFLPSLAVNLLLAWFFGRTLAAGRIPLVTSIARFVRDSPSLAPERERYTRRVTWAWCVFFVATAAISVSARRVRAARRVVDLRERPRRAARRGDVRGRVRLPPAPARRPRARAAAAVLRRLVAAGFAVTRPSAK